MIVLLLKDSLKTRLSIAEGGNSLRGFSKKAGISHAYLSQILNGKRNPSPEIGHRIAKGLDLKIEDIFLIKLVGDNNQKEETTTNDN